MVAAKCPPTGGLKSSPTYRMQLYLVNSEKDWHMATTSTRWANKWILHSLKYNMIVLNVRQ